VIKMDQTEMDARLERLKKIDPDKCLHYTSSRTQRDNELADGEGKYKATGFQKMGCLECDGFNRTCDSYTSLNKLKDMRQ